MQSINFLKKFFSQKFILSISDLNVLFWWLILLEVDFLF